MKAISKKRSRRPAIKKEPLKVYVVKPPATIRDYIRTYGITVAEILKAGELMRKKVRATA